MKEKIAIYGLSIETEKKLPDLIIQYEIVGLLDSYRTDGMVYGYPVISINEAVSDHIDKIIVIARPGSCKAIAGKIGDICQKNGIDLFDIRGKNLLQRKKSIYDFKFVEGYTRKELLDAIDKAEAVSFDLFDTLVMRQVTNAGDVIEILDAQLRMEGISISDFVAKRLMAEKQMSQGYAPTLEEIYGQIADENKLSRKKMALKEFQLDKKLLVPRIDVIDIMKITKKHNKKVYITSDSYYTKEQIKEIITENGISEYDDIFVSCEYGISKQTGLFTELKKVADTGNIIHIGDDIISDVESGIKSGLKTFHIYSGTELFDLIGEFGLEINPNSISDKIKIGMFLARVFNSPFHFESEEKNICIDNDKDLGYVFFAPMIHDFVQWFGNQVEKYNCSNIWFCARDGFLIQKVYELSHQDHKSHYFLTSRTAAVRAGVKTESDIVSVDTMKYFGNASENLKRRFGIDAEKLSDADVDNDQEELLKYKKVILETANIKRQNNKRYIENLSLVSGKIAFFDFVAKGTCQMYTQRLVNNPLIGLYFLQLEPDYAQREGMKVIPFYTEEERENSVIFDDYYILEPILTAPDPSLEEFDGEGKPVYAEETRKKTDIECFLNVQKGIIEYEKRYLDICPAFGRTINKSLDEGLMKLLHYFQIKDTEFTKLIIEDPFFNRSTNMEDVI